MVGLGFLMLGILLVTLYLNFEGTVENRPRFLRWIIFTIPLPYLANSAGWILAEVGRQPWMVFGLQRVEDAVSPTVSSGAVLFSLIAFTLIYGALMAADLYLLRKFATNDSIEIIREPQESPRPAAVYSGD